MTVVPTWCAGLIIWQGIRLEQTVRVNLRGKSLSFPNLIDPHRGAEKQTGTYLRMGLRLIFKIKTTLAKSRYIR